MGMKMKRALIGMAAVAAIIGTPAQAADCCSQSRASAMSLVVRNQLTNLKSNKT
jgi:hypothetical protein